MLLKKNITCGVWLLDQRNFFQYVTISAAKLEIFWHAATSLSWALQTLQQSNINDNRDNNEKRKIIKKPGWEYLKTSVGIFQVGIFWVGIFRVGIHQAGVWLVRIFQVGLFRLGVFLIPECFAKLVSPPSRYE